MVKQWKGALVALVMGALLMSGACVVETDMVPRSAEAECFGSDEPSLPGDTPGNPPGGDTQADDVCAGIETAEPAEGGDQTREYRCPYTWIMEDGEKRDATRRQPGPSWKYANDMHYEWCADKSRLRAPQKFVCRDCAQEPISSSEPPFVSGNPAPSSDDLKDRTCSTVGSCVVGTDISPHQHTQTWPATTESDARAQNEHVFRKSCSGAAVIDETDCSDRGVADDQSAAAARFLCTGTMVCQAQGGEPKYKELSCIHRPPGTAVMAKNAAAAGNVLARRCGAKAQEETGHKFWVCGTRPSVDGPWECKRASNSNGG